MLQSEVQKIMSYPKKSKKRKQLLNSLRKKGNYIINSSGNSARIDDNFSSFKPMKSDTTATADEYLPCSFCFGYYKKKTTMETQKNLLRKRPPKVSKNAQAEGQNMLLRHLKIDVQLIEQVFPRMRADKVSIVAKKDPLICAFGAKYLKMHREKHFINVTSRKMR